MFFEFNTSRGGNLTKEELLNAFWRNGFQNVTSFQIDQLFSYLDGDGSGTLDFIEFF